MTDDLEVVFSDKNLEAAVREALKKPEGPLTRGVLKGMKELTATGLSHQPDPAPARRQREKRRQPTGFTHQTVNALAQRQPAESGEHRRSRT